jgi:hypothetical protein
MNLEIRSDRLADLRTRAEQWLAELDRMVPNAQDFPEIGRRFLQQRETLRELLAALIAQEQKQASVENGKGILLENWLRVADANYKKTEALKATEASLAALRPYVQHKPECASLKCQRELCGIHAHWHVSAKLVYRHDFVGGICSCGLSAVLAASEPTRP